MGILVALNSDTLAAIAAIVVAAIIGALAWDYSGRRKRSVDPDEVVTIAAFASETEVAEWKMRLGQFGVRSASFGNGFSRGLAMRGALSGPEFFLQVRRKEAPRAIKILRESGCKGIG